MSTSAEQVLALTYEQALMVADVTFGGCAGVLDAIDAGHDFTDADIYSMFVPSMGKMMATENGPQTAQVMLAALLTQMMRARIKGKS